MKIVFSYRAIDGIAGGLERMSNMIMNTLAQRGHEVHFITLDHKNATSFYPLHENVTWHRLDIGNYRQKATLRTRLRRLGAIRSILKSVKPEVIIAFQDGNFFTMRCASVLMHIPVILSERISPQQFNYIKAGQHLTLRRQLYRAATKIAIQCESYKTLYPAYLRDKLVTIPNPVPLASKHASPDTPTNNRKILLCAGRLCFQKNQMVLLQSFLRIADKFSDWDLVFAGDGEHDQDLKAAAKGHAQIKFMGQVSDMPALYTQSNLFCIPSRWEGFPNALAEALAHGLPCIGFEGCLGVRDLIHRGKNGLLAEGTENVDTLAEALQTLMKNENQRKLMGQNAVESVKQYKPEMIFDLWEDFLHKTAAR